LSLFFKRVDLIWNNSKIDFLLFLNIIAFQCNISLRNVIFPDYEIPIKLKKITDNRIKSLITSKQKDTCKMLYFKILKNWSRHVQKTEKISEVTVFKNQSFLNNGKQQVIVFYQFAKCEKKIKNTFFG
jgi:hypothetical protein